MSAQATTATPVLEGEDAGPGYGAALQAESRATHQGGQEELAQGSHVVMNGVDPRREEESRVDPPRADPRDAGLAQEGHIAPGPLDTSVPAELVEATVSRPSLDAEVRPGEGSNFMSLTESPPSPRRPRIAAGSHGDQPHQAERTVEMAAYSYEAAEGAPGIRWVARLTEFLRATTTRTHGLQGRVLEGLGFTTTQGTHPAMLAQTQQTAVYQQQHRQQQMQPPAFSPIRRIGDLNFSPPEELPPQHQGRQVQLSQGLLPAGDRASMVQRRLPEAEQTQLFTPDQQQRLRQLPREAPLIYPPTEGSTSSEEVQAEARRLLSQYVRRYEGETTQLRDEVQQLRMQRDQLIAASMVQQPLLAGDRASMVQQPLPGGDRASMVQQPLPGGDRASMVQQPLPGGDRASMAQHSLPGGDRANAAYQQYVPEGATMDRHGLPVGIECVKMLVCLEKNRVEYYDMSSADREWRAQQHGGPRIPDGAQQHGGPRIPDGAQQHGGPRVPDGAQQHGGPRIPDGAQQHGGPRVPDGAQQHGGPRAPDGANQPEGSRESDGNDQKEPTQLDLLSVIATGMRQLQDAQTKAFQKRGTTDEPEPVKPGVSVLPVLKAPDPATSPVEVQDWLQLLQAPMSDLSDNSGEWWARVQELAQKSYQEWSGATPMERLTMRAPKEKELEEGRFARLNARAASMILSALDESVKADLVMRKSTKSTSQILYRVLTLYQPGGEGEKRLVLDQLQTPTKHAEPDKAAKGLRDWERWHRRASDVGVSPPDPTVLLRALSSIMAGVLESYPEAAFRTSLIRNNLKLDTNPTEQAVLSFHRLP